MTTVAERIGSFEYDPQRGRFKGWLRTMVKNRVRNLLRDRRHLQAASQDFKRMQEPGPAPDELFDKLWRREHLKHCLRLIKTEVDESTFKAFVAYVLEEQPVEQICDDLQMTANQVHAIKSRMIKRIRGRMRELVGPEEPCDA
jgi:RNA polymerase sigma-70 factor (ECF subfamily)